jgi:hypothetical protein
VFMRVCLLSSAFRMTVNDTEEYHPTLAGIAGLRHKSRHKFAEAIRPIVQGVAPPTPAERAWSRTEKILEKMAKSGLMGRSKSAHL